MMLLLMARRKRTTKMSIFEVVLGIADDDNAALLAGLGELLLAQKWSMEITRRRTIFGKDGGLAFALARSGAYMEHSARVVITELLEDVQPILARKCIVIGVFGVY
uniref:Uncharacterized protein n=1 Tax=Oryza punctata TaxID=4537 RepID=A0A0E0LE21_ORYPU